MQGTYVWYNLPKLCWKRQQVTIATHLGVLFSRNHPNRTKI